MGGQYLTVGLVSRSGLVSALEQAEIICPARDMCPQSGEEKKEGARRTRYKGMANENQNSRSWQTVTNQIEGKGKPNISARGPKRWNKHHEAIFVLLRYSAKLYLQMWPDLRSLSVPWNLLGMRQCSNPYGDVQPDLDTTKCLTFGRQET